MGFTSRVCCRFAYARLKVNSDLAQPILVLRALAPLPGTRVNRGLPRALRGHNVTPRVPDGTAEYNIGFETTVST